MLQLCDSLVGGRRALGELKFAGGEECSEKEWDMAEQVCSYICKFILYDYEFIASRSPELLGAAAARLTLPVLGRRSGQLPPSLGELELAECVVEVVALLRGHSERFSGLSNLFKFADKGVVEKV